MRTRLSKSPESGAVAVLFALLAVVVIGSGALAVDLGNAFARKRISQTQADLAALAGAAKLPDAGSAIDLAFDYLWDNGVLGQFGDEATVEAQMKNASRDDGDIWVDADGHLNVLTPPAQVDYALGGVFQQSGIDVQAYAQAGVFSPGKLAPFFIAQDCLVPGGSRLEITPDPGNVTPTPISPLFYPSPSPLPSNWPELTGAPSPFETFAASDTSAPIDPLAQTVTLPGQSLDFVEDVAFVWGETEDERVTLSESAPPPVEPIERTVADVTIEEDALGVVTTSVVDAFTIDDEGESITVPGAGEDGADLETTIESYIDGSTVSLLDAASQAVDGVVVTVEETPEGPDTPLSFSVELGAKKNDPDILTVSVPYEAIDLTPAPFDQERVVFLQVRPAGSQWSEPLADASFTVPLPGATLPDKCGEKSTGDFGLISSPRDGVSQEQKAAQQNVALGLDHPVFPYPGDDPVSALESQSIPKGASDGAKWNDICVKYTASPPFVLDEDGAINPNCLNIYPGLKPEILDRGLIEGDSDYDGRLVSGATESCMRTRDVVMKKSWTINDDLLSCYLKNGLRIADLLSAGTVDVLEPEIVQSPRFMLVPVLFAEYPPSNGNYPIVGFKGAMISAEAPNSTKASPKPETDNGLIISEKKVGSMTVTYFDLEALPEQVSTTGSVVDYIGSGPKVVRLLK